MVKRATTCLLLCLVVLTVMAAKKKQPAISVTAAIASSPSNIRCLLMGIPPYL